MGGLLLGEELKLGLRHFDPFFCGTHIDLLLHQRVNTQPGQIALHVTPVVAVSSATTFVKPTMPCLAAT